MVGPAPDGELRCGCLQCVRCVLGDMSFAGLFGRSEELDAVLLHGGPRRFSGFSDALGRGIGEGTVVGCDGQPSLYGIVLYGDHVASGRTCHGFYVVWNAPYYRHDFRYWLAKPVEKLVVRDDLFRYLASGLPLAEADAKALSHCVYYWQFESEV